MITRSELLQLIRDVDRWVGVEPLGEEQWAEAGEVRRRVRDVVETYDRSVNWSKGRACSSSPWSANMMLSVSMVCPDKFLAWIKYRDVLAGNAPTIEEAKLLAEKTAGYRR